MIKEIITMRAYERLIKYAKIYTTSDSGSGSCPSTERQIDLARILAEDMKAIGISGVRLDKFGYVYGYIPATPGYEGKRSLGLIAHMDTSEAAPGEGVKPILHENYDGNDIYLDGGTVIKTATFPFLKDMVGETLITSDGTTLLGADDKAGISEILTACEIILSENIPHGKICVGFTPDEEIGRGADKFDIEGFGADFAFTVDGGDAGEIEYENFNAAAAAVTVKGFSVHPGDAKNRMINAVNVGIEFHNALPSYERPEHTEGREGFYHLDEIKGDISCLEMYYILRDHDLNKLEEKKDTMRHVEKLLNEKYGSGTVTVDIRDNYRNMIEKVRPHFHLIETARKATRLAGLEPKELPVRGGTDGAVLSWKGLPCPNLGVGGFNFHGCAEFATAERMDKAAEIVVNIIKLYAEQ